MAISVSWINDYVDTTGVDLNELALKITKAGINIEAVNSKRIDNLVIGKVLECSNHPDSDHLHVLKVDVGSEIYQIVCGASNVSCGIKVIVALPGAVLPGNFVIKESTIRGVTSCGMVCALFELGKEEKTEENYNKGIHIVEDDVEVGTDANVYLGFDDVSYELDLNPNRFDCNNHIPFSYEVAAVLGKKVKLPDVSYTKINEDVNKYMKLKVETKNCTMYNLKMVTDVKVGPSPDFIKNRLELAGMRSINNVVDISNYVMLEYGQPLHFFDKEKVGDTILVRMANEKEKIKTLDKVERTLSSDDIVITDGKKPICIAGVMGGYDSSVDDNTKTIVIESAIFNPYNVRYTSINHNLRSEASLRYEKGLNYEYCNMAIERSCHLLEKYAGAKVLDKTICYDEVEKSKKCVKVDLKDINNLLGLILTVDDCKKSLDGLGFSYINDGDIFDITIPNRRLDVINHVNDMAEEVGRLYGYDSIVGKLPKVLSKPGRYTGTSGLRKDISKRLRAMGLNEARTYLLVSEELNEMFKYNRGNSITLLKPMSDDKKIIRQTLIPSLLKVVDYNNARGVKDILLYEIANVYFDDDKEDTLVSALMTGNYMIEGWHGVNKMVDFYLIKGIVCNLLDYLGFKNRYTFIKKENDGLHPGISASILLDREEIGFIGKVHPLISKNDIYVFEFSMKKVFDKKVKALKYKEVSKYPSVVKDLAFIVKEEISSDQVIDAIRKSGGRLLKDINVFDVYKGENIDNNLKSLAFSLTFMDDTRTLTEEEVMDVFNKIIKSVCEKLDAKLRDK